MIKKIWVLSMLAATGFFLAPSAGRSCTTFVLDNDGQPVYGKNMDWRPPVTAYVLVNKRGVQKTSLAPPEETTKTWTSQYGSVTFNFWGREFPFEGINEAGLFISSMSLFDINEFPEPDERPRLFVFQWVQYQLDNFSTIEEVIEDQQEVRIPSWDDTKGAHFLVGDGTGNSAVLVWINGQLVVYQKETLPAKVLTNTEYGQSLDILGYFKGYGGMLPVPRKNFMPVLFLYANSYLRFVCATDMLRKFDPQGSRDAVDYAFEVLDRVVMVPAFGKSIWRTVYDAGASRIYFTSWYNDAIRFFDLTALDFSCATPVKVLDVNAQLSGDVTELFVDYTAEINRSMVTDWNNSSGDMTDEVVDIFVAYPETHTFCTEGLD